jgi:type II secretory pathway component GspD/PulD (secretin)
VRDVTGSGANGLPEITFRRAATTVRVKDGESIVIGGLINEFSTSTRSKLPILGDIPLLGHLFRHTSSHRVKTEVVIIITPHVLGPSRSVEPQAVPLEADAQ